MHQIKKLNNLNVFFIKKFKYHFNFSRKIHLYRFLLFNAKKAKQCLKNSKTKIFTRNKDMLQQLVFSHFLCFFFSSSSCDMDWWAKLKVIKVQIWAFLLSVNLPLFLFLLFWNSTDPVPFRYITGVSSSSGGRGSCRIQLHHTCLDILI